MTTFATPAPPRLDVELDAGSLRITTADIDTTEVEVRPHRDDADSRQRAAETTVEQHGNEIVVRPPRHGRSWIGRSAALDIIISCPHDAEMRVSCGSADLTADGRFGTTDLGAGSGAVVVGHIAGSARVRAGSGDVRVDSVEGDLDVRTGSGDVHVDAVSGAMSAKSGSGQILLGKGGRALSATTGSGGVTVLEAPHELGVKSGSGDVRMTAVRNGAVSVKAASGAIHAGIAEGTAAWLDVHTVSGRVVNDLAAADEPSGGDQRVHLRLHTVSGNITIARA